MKRLPKTRCTGPRAAYTLVEVLVALGLSAILLAAVYSALDLYWRYSTAGQAEVERSQVARALLQQMALDIRSIVFQESDSSEDDGSGTVSEDIAQAGDLQFGEVDDPNDQSGEIRIVDPADETQGSSAGLMGNSEILVINISKPRRELTFTPSMVDADLIQSRSSDLRKVSYFLAGSGGALQSAVASQNATNDLNGGKGLARTEGDSLAVDLADEQGNIGTLAASAKILAPEVTRIQFRYFDGQTWQLSWDSVERNGLPRAVEIELELGPPDDVVVPNRKTASEPEPSVYRLVVAIPTARPFDPEMDL